eukprot:scaffold660642_cov60-Prasinocladus_malaysianus.AAC.1
MLLWMPLRPVIGLEFRGIHTSTENSVARSFSSAYDVDNFDAMIRPISTSQPCTARSKLFVGMFISSDVALYTINAQ